MRINPFFLHGEELTPVRTLLALHALAGGVPLTEYTVTGNPVSFETNVAKPLTECLVSFSPVQSGTGDPSPENIRPITGWTGANVYLSPTDADDPAKQTFAVTFPAEAGTVYGGTLDITTGVLTVDKAEYILTGTYESYVCSNASYIKADACDAYFNNNAILYNTGAIICNMLKKGNGIWNKTGFPNCFAINGKQIHLNIANDLIGVTDYTQETTEDVATKIKGYIKGLYDNGTPMIFVYALATPLVYQLTPQEIQTLIGTNVLWSDTNGDMEVKYLKKG